MVPDNRGSAVDDVLDVINSNIGRWVAFILTPILLPLVGAAAYWLQNVAGVDLQNMDPAVVTGYLVAVVGGLAATLVTWLRNRGKYEIAAVEGIAAADAAAAVVERRLDREANAATPAVMPVPTGTTVSDVVIGGSGRGRRGESEASDHLE